jgi:hypothetical protein
VDTPFRSPAARSATAVATALAVGLLSGATLTASAVDQPTGNGWSMTEPSDAHARFVDKHGRALKSPQLYLIYWGSAWQASPTPNAAQITDAVRTLLASAYLTGLIQYRGSGHGVLRGSALVPSDPPDGFTDDQVADFVDDQITAGTVPGPDPDNQTVYGVVLPTGVSPESPGWTGEHNYHKRSGQKIPYAWFSNGGDLAGITGIISHELVEAATNPDGHGFLGVKGTCGDRSGWCEIADVCESTWSTVDGVTVQGYWSNQDNECIAPSSVAPDPIEPEPVAPARAGNMTIHPATGHAQGEAP